MPFRVLRPNGGSVLPLRNSPSVMKPFCSSLGCSYAYLQELSHSRDGRAEIRHRVKRPELEFAHSFTSHSTTGGRSSFVFQPPDQVDPGTADAAGVDLRREGEQSSLLARFQLQKPHAGYRRNLE